MSETKHTPDSAPSPHTGRRLVYSEDCLYEVFQEPDDSYVMTAEVNRSASFTITFRLNEEESALLQREGAKFAQSLALRVDSSPEFFRDRAI
jgi:hypothetical protein